LAHWYHDILLASVLERIKKRLETSSAHEERHHSAVLFEAMDDIGSVDLSV